MELETGMVIYEERPYSNILRKGEIVRTTKTLAIALFSNGLEYRFNRIQEKSFFYEKGNNNYIKKRYYAATYELNEKYYRQQLLTLYKKIEPDKLTITQLRKIIYISKETK